MIYSLSVTIPPNTQADNPIQETIECAQGLITRVHVRWRWGSANLCGVQLAHSGFKQWPLTIGEWFPSNPSPLEFPERYSIAVRPFALTLRAYNLDDTYEHTVWVGVVVEQPVYSPGIDSFLRYLDRGF